MVNYKRILKKIERENYELKERRLRIPSQLSKTRKAQERKEISSAGIKLSRYEKDIKEKQKQKKKTAKEIKKFLSKKLSRPKSILKKSKAELTIPDKKVESIWEDTNRFFKSEMEEAKQAMFFK